MGKGKRGKWVEEKGLNKLWICYFMMMVISDQTLTNVLLCW